MAHFRIMSVYTVNKFKFESVSTDSPQIAQFTVTQLHNYLV